MAKIVIYNSNVVFRAKLDLGTQARTRELYVFKYFLYIRRLGVYNVFIFYLYGCNSTLFQNILMTRWLGVYLGFASTSVGKIERRERAYLVGPALTVVRTQREKWQNHVAYVSLDRKRGKKL